MNKTRKPAQKLFVQLQCFENKVQTKFLLDLIHAEVQVNI